VFDSQSPERAFERDKGACVQGACQNEEVCEGSMREALENLVRGASVSRRKVSMAWGCGGLVVLKSGEVRQWVTAQTTAAYGSRVSVLSS